MGGPRMLVGGVADASQFRTAKTRCQNSQEELIPAWTAPIAEGLLIPALIIPGPQSSAYHSKGSEVEEMALNEAVRVSFGTSAARTFSRGKECDSWLTDFNQPPLVLSTHCCRSRFSPGSCREKTGRFRWYLSENAPADLEASGPGPSPAFDSPEMKNDMHSNRAPE
ncbi:hypothetical protein MKZ38_009869 [Zalerion maritima]|uniref:Uncharacterized protein n=1 Tax=Zalerion maritima TaxID=339359 RepID=A0AAD5WUU5_9PEZI|nr:hypothetical protein MKZ38_009869 [Zalerion maritima]